ncbi:unnamed protein product [Closterium sp. NIES-64]|nr:unnamed protein product [Closterium sp. NIES-64]
MRGGRVNIVLRQEAVEEKRAGTAARGVSVGEVVRGSGAEEGGQAAASHMTVREGEHVGRGCAAGVGERAAAGRGDSAAAEERGTAVPISHAHAQPAPTCADLPVLGAMTPGASPSHPRGQPPTLGAAGPWSDAALSMGSHRSAHADACASMEGHLSKEPSLLVFSGGTAFNAVAEALHEWTTTVAHVLPVSDDGGSTAVIVRVIGQPLTHTLLLSASPLPCKVVLLLPHHAATSRCHTTLPHHASHAPSSAHLSHSAPALTPSSRTPHPAPLIPHPSSRTTLSLPPSGPAIGDIRSRCLRLSDGSSHEARAVRRLLGHRLPLHPAQAKAEWLSIVEGEHELWGDVSDPYKEIIRAFLLHFHYQVRLLHFHYQPCLSSHLPY